MLILVQFITVTSLENVYVFGFDGPKIESLDMGFDQIGQEQVRKQS